MATLAHPYEANTFPSLSHKILNEPPTPMGSHRARSAHLESLALQMLRRDPATRASIPHLLEDEMVQQRMLEFVKEEEAKLQPAGRAREGRAREGRASEGRASRHFGLRYVCSKKNHHVAGTIAVLPYHQRVAWEEGDQIAGRNATCCEEPGAMKFTRAHTAAIDSFCKIFDARDHHVAAYLRFCNLTRLSVVLPHVDTICFAAHALRYA